MLTIFWAKTRVIVPKKLRRTGNGKFVCKYISLCILCIHLRTPVPHICIYMWLAQGVISHCPPDKRNQTEKLGVQWRYLRFFYAVCVQGRSQSELSLNFVWVFFYHRRLIRTLRVKRCLIGGKHGRMRILSGHPLRSSLGFSTVLRFADSSVHRHYDSAVLSFDLAESN